MCLPACYGDQHAGAVANRNSGAETCETPGRLTEDEPRSRPADASVPITTMVIYRSPSTYAFQPPHRDVNHFPEDVSRSRLEQQWQPNDERMPLGRLARLYGTVNETPLLSDRDADNSSRGIAGSTGPQSWLFVNETERTTTMALHDEPGSSTPPPSNDYDPDSAEQISALIEQMGSILARTKTELWCGPRMSW